MQTKQAVEKLIEKTAAALSYPPSKHLCLTCTRYIRGFCTVGMDITHGSYYEDMLLDLISREWENKHSIPSVSISIIRCKRYKKD
ncbi:MAG: hypothetical protein N3D15_02795 [Syntrophorhabdaceae bacterium]|nr:hypothetical protein [Syntrophorhabdaceae bacterium]